MENFPPYFVKFKIVYTSYKWTIRSVGQIQLPRRAVYVRILLSLMEMKRVFKSSQVSLFGSRYAAGWEGDAIILQTWSYVTLFNTILLTTVF